MPVRRRSRCSNSAIHFCPSFEACLIWSSSSLKPGRMTPPSDVLRGGSSTMALSMSVMMSSLLESRRIICTRDGICTAAFSGREERTSSAARRPLASATRSRGEAMRWRTRFVRRSMSPAFLRASTSRACKSVLPSSSLITCCRCSRIEMSSSGWLIQRRIKRPPIGLRVLSRTHSNEPLTEPLRPVSKSSRLRRVWVSSVIKPLV